MPPDPPSMGHLRGSCLWQHYSHVDFAHKVGNPLPQILDPPLLQDLLQDHGFASLRMLAPQRGRRRLLLFITIIIIIRPRLLTPMVGVYCSHKRRTIVTVSLSIRTTYRLLPPTAPSSPTSPSSITVNSSPMIKGRNQCARDRRTLSFADHFHRTKKTTIALLCCSR